MRKLSGLAGLLALALCGHAADIKYPVSAIPASLKTNAHVVKRMEESELRIVNTGEMVLRHKYALTILDENGEDNAVLVEYYDKLQQVRSIEGALYDAAGNQLKKLKGKDIQDISAVDDNNLMDDNRRKVHQFFYRSYPYTIEYEVETKFNNSLFFPAWVPVEDEHFSVEKSSFTIIAPAGYTFRSKAFNYAGTPVTTTDKDKVITRWEVSALPAIEMPYASPSWRELTTMVLFAPGAFEIEGYKGNMSSWQEFGKFVFSLTRGKDKLPDATAQKVQHLTAGISDEKEKIRVLYRFLQQQTRYISIQLGLGGWQPFEAGYVAQKGYGDCKALTNYMYSLLKSAGIRSCYTLVKAGASAQPVEEDFPSQQFNHVILCVPLAKDTMWLECTDQTLPAGYVSDFTANRKALVIDENGGTLVATPRYSIRENRQVRTVHSKLESDGTLNMKVETNYDAMEGDYLHQVINMLSKEKVQKILQQELELSTYSVNDFAYSESNNGLPRINERLDVTVPGYATVSGKRIFITPNILNRSGSRLEVDEERKADFVFRSEYRNEDAYEIEIPEGYAVESAPQDVSLNTRFGTYSISYKLQGNKLTCRRVREQYAGRFPAKEGAALARFFSDMYKADRSRMVLVKKEG